MKYSETVKRGGTSKDRRRYRRRFGIKSATVSVHPALDEVHPIGTERRLNTEEYGKSYKGTLGTVVGYDNGQVMFKVKKRVKPLLVHCSHLTD